MGEGVTSRTDLSYLPAAMSPVPVHVIITAAPPMVWVEGTTRARVQVEHRDQ
jgi:hypothetical protein